MKKGFSLASLVFIVQIFATSAYSLKVHVLNPWAEDSVWQIVPLWIRGDDPGHYPGKQMKDEGENWWSYTFTDALATKPGQGHYKFFIVVGLPPNFEGSQGFDLTGVVSNARDSKPANRFVEWELFHMDSAEAVEEAWIWLDKSGKVVVSPYSPDSKVLYLFNPWPQSAPRIKIGNADYKDMNLAKDEGGNVLCGWFVTYFTAETNYSVHFQEIIGKTLVYGKTGLGSAEPLDLALHYATSKVAYILPSPQPTGTIEAGPPTVQSVLPQGILGQCQYNLAFTIRDFSVEHPDFYAGEIMGALPVTGMVEDKLGSNGKPVKKKDLHNSKFEEWFQDVPGVNYQKCLDLPMSKTKDGYWQYDSYYTDAKGNPNASHQFFPIDDFNNFNETYAAGYKVKRGETFVNQWRKDPTGEHNFHFCLELHAKFKYEKGQQFTFTGDDDVWVFVNKQLVIDLGGLHPPSVGKIPLDLLGLTEGEEYSFDFFYCERQPVGSNMMVKTSIYFEQELNFFFTQSEQGTTKKINIWKREGGSGSCADVLDPGNLGKIDTLPAKANIYLSGGGLPAEIKLNDGNPYKGKGLDISNETEVVLDTVKLRTSDGGLAPGNYVLKIESKDPPKRVLTVPFRVYGGYSVMFKGKRVVDQIAGSMVEVIVQATQDEQPILKSVPFKMTTGGLTIYDSTGSTPLTALTNLKTDSITGQAKFMVSVATTIPKKATYSLKVDAERGGDVWDMTFWIPLLQFVDPTKKTVLKPQPILDKTLKLGYPVMVQVTDGKGALCATCSDALNLVKANVKFTLDASSKIPITQIIPVGGYAFFYAFSDYVQNVEFTVQGVSPGTKAVWTSDVSVSYIVKRAWMVDSDKRGDADKLFVRLDGSMSKLPGSVTSIDWPAEGMGNKSGNAANISKIDDSTFVVDFTQDQFQKGLTEIDASAPPAMQMPDGGTAVIEDGVGPILVAAEIVMPQYKRYILEGDPTNTVKIMPDTLVLTASEAVIASANGPPNQWKNLVFYGLTCKDGESGMPVPMDAEPSISGKIIKLPVVKNENGKKIEIGNCVYFNQATTYTDSKGNTPAPVPVDIGGIPSDFEIFSTSLLRPVVGSQDPKLSEQMNMPNYKPIALLDEKGNFKAYHQSEALEVWIPPVYMDKNGILNEKAMNNCGPATVLPPRLFPQNCLSAISVLSEGAYKADVSIFTNLGEFIHHSEQHFGYCGELEDENRLRPEGYASFLIWNLKDLTGRYVGSGVYLWKVLYHFKNGTTRTEAYRQGIVRSNDPDPECAVTGP